MDEMDFKSKFSQSSEVLLTLFENGKSPLSDQFLRWKLWARWKDVVGESIAKNAEPVGFSRGCLYLWVKNSTWLQQMTFMREQIRETINFKMGRPFVHAIRFTLDRRDVPVDAQDQTELKQYVEKLAPPQQDGE